MIDGNIRMERIDKKVVEADVYKKMKNKKVMIGDVIKRIKENREISYWEYLVKLLGQLSRPWLWRELGLSIDDQSQECVDFVYSIINN